MNGKSIYKGIILFALSGFLITACTIPFLFESPSIFYKTGAEKIMLRTGKILGIAALVLMVYQLILISRFALLEKIFGMKALYQAHRLNGRIILAAVIAHPILILGADNFVFFPVEKKYWPEFTGIFLAFLIVFFIGISIFNKRIGITYKTWRMMHKTIAPFIFILLFIHILYVSRTFESGTPLYFLIATGVACLAMIIGKWLKR
jgi:predicted ferric reductase